MGTGNNGVPDVENRQIQACTAGDREVGQASDTWGKAIDVLEDNWEGLKGHVENAVDEREICAGGGDDGLKEQHTQRPSEDHGEELIKVRLLKIARSNGSRFWIGLAHLLGAVGEQDGAVRLWEEGG